MDSGFDRVPRQSVATDAERAAALATPPQFILMSEEAVGVASSFWRDQILPEIQDQWHSTSAPAGTFVFGTLTGVFVSYRHLFGLEYGEALVIVDATTPSGMSFGLR